jgi:hypothetical protein
MRPIEGEGYEGPFPTRVALWRVSIDPDRQEVRLDLEEELGLQPEMEGKFPTALAGAAVHPPMAGGSSGWRTGWGKGT